MPVFKRNKFERFHGDVQDANTLRKKRSNRDTEKSQKVQVHWTANMLVC